ncbi:amino acid ABC transporter substrate-binding protein [Geomonas anaerohicana]|uniref:Amino acid ABC transporter substrate-binding protein n=1 Tax=Geomonas anaerohicana TaxID=2798583 RepID=A0ABS0Y9K5_9BACT|nr:amino acid ABC transporter substrate-binding protein [Geomonas anaerohicana]MBJ6748993.1 amino acid ABC transporter substrate-binding protein [Geomonas anaerohicana]
MKFGFVRVLLLIAALFVAIPAHAEQRNFFKIGVITELSGDLVTGGNITKRGYDLWAQEVNAKGGIEIQGKKYPVKLVYADAQSNPAAGAAAAERLITQEKVDFILGPYSSGVTLAVAPVVDKYKIPMITGSAESPLIWKNKFKYTFGTIPPINFTGATSIKTLTEMKPAPKTIAIIGSNDAFSKATAESYKAAAEKAKLKIVKFSIVPSGQDMTPLLSAVRSMKPDVIAFGGHDEEHVKFVKALKQIGYTPKALLMHCGITDKAFIDAVGKDGEQIFGTTCWTGTAKTKSKVLWPNAAAYAAASQKAFNNPGDYTQGGCSAAGIAFQTALQKIGAKPGMDEATRTKLIAALEQIDVQTFYGRVKFATSGEFYHANVGLDPLTVQIQSGQVKTVGPKASVEAPAIYPMKEWKSR